MIKKWLVQQMIHQDINHDLINKDESCINHKNDIINRTKMDNNGFGLNDINDHYSGNGIPSPGVSIMTLIGGVNVFAGMRS